MAWCPRCRHPHVHRWLGRVYLGGGVLAGGVSGLLLAPNTFGGPAANLGFGLLALLWLTSGWRAYRAIRQGQVDKHRHWMLRNFALAFAAVTLPFVWLGGLAEPVATSKALASGLAEMFLPALMLKGADPVVRYVAAVVSVSSVLFFSGSIPCVLATRIPISLRQMVGVWFVRTALSILLAAGVGHIAFAQGWIA